MRPADLAATAHAGHDLGRFVLADSHCRAGDGAGAADRGARGAGRPHAAPVCADHGERPAISALLEAVRHDRRHQFGDPLRADRDRRTPVAGFAGGDPECDLAALRRDLRLSLVARPTDAAQDRRAGAGLPGGGGAGRLVAAGAYDGRIDRRGLLAVGRGQLWAGQRLHQGARGGAPALGYGDRQPVGGGCGAHAAGSVHVACRRRPAAPPSSPCLSWRSSARRWRI